MESSEFENVQQSIQDLEQRLHDGTYFLIEQVKNKHRWEIKKSIQPNERNNPVCLESLSREFEIGSQLQHPNICSYYQHFPKENVLYREYIDGLAWDVYFNLYRDESLCIEKYILQLMDAIHYMHTKGIFHMDLKSDNILISNEVKNLKVIDFGHAVYHNDTLWRGGVLSGSTDNNLINAHQDWNAFFLLVRTNKSNLSKKINRKIDKAHDLFIQNQHQLDLQHTKAIFEKNEIIGIRGKFVVLTCAILCLFFLFMERKNPDKNAIYQNNKRKENHSLNFPSTQASLPLTQPIKNKKTVSNSSPKTFHSIISKDDSLFFVAKANLFGPEFETKLKSKNATKKHQLFDSLVRDYNVKFYELTKLRLLDSSKVSTAKKIYTYQLSISINKYVHLLK